MAKSKGKQSKTSALTLAQAQRIAKSRVPQPKSKAAVAATSLASVAAERERLELRRQIEDRQRIREYAETMRLLKEHGVKGLAPASKAGQKATKPQPLQVFAEGDSWFDYPVPFFGGGILPRLQKRIGVPILDLAKAGDEVRFMLGVKQRKIIASQLSSGCPAGGPWDAMLFSGGGNDIVHDPMAMWIRQYDPNIPLPDHLHKARLAAALELVRAGYEDLIGLRDALSPNTHLVFHCYDYAIPDGRGVCHLGPWMKPTFDLRGFPTQQSAFLVVKTMLDQFAALLAMLEATHPRVTVVKTLGTLPELKTSWHNELHPSKAGFNRFADLFHGVLKGLFPTKVL